MVRDESYVTREVFATLLLGKVHNVVYTSKRGSISIVDYYEKPSIQSHSTKKYTGVPGVQTYSKEKI